MEGVSVTAYRGIKSYWRRKGYERLHAGRRRKTRVVRLGGGSGNDGGDTTAGVPRRRFWRVRFGPRLKLRLRFSPKKFLLRLRNAYVNMMMRIANSRAVAASGGYIGGDQGLSGFGVRPLKEYDEKVIVEIYKSIVMAQGRSLVPRDEKWVGSEITTTTTNNKLMMMSS